MYFKRLKDIRIENNLTQTDIARILELDRTTYTSFELGRDTISITKLNIFINYFKTSFDYIFEFTNQKSYQNGIKDIDKDIVAKRLKESRKENKLTQVKLGNLLNTDHSVWCRYEKAKVLIQTTFLYSYAKEINISADYLLGKIDSPKYLK